METTTSNNMLSRTIATTEAKVSIRSFGKNGIGLERPTISVDLGPLGQIDIQGLVLSTDRPTIGLRDGKLSLRTRPNRSKMESILFRLQRGEIAIADALEACMLCAEDKNVGNTKTFYNGTSVFITGKVVGEICKGAETTKVVKAPKTAKAIKAPKTTKVAETAKKDSEIIF